MDIDVFVSYHVRSSSHITEAVVNSLEANNIRCWYAPRDTSGPYASSIADAIAQCRVFIMILNKESSFSQDVLNELNLAFERMRKGEDIEIIPFQTTPEDISNDAKYYIGRLHWLDAITPPLEERIRELTEKVNKVVERSRMRLKKLEGSSASVRSKLHSTRLMSNHNFIGREEEISELENILETEQIVFLYGSGGTGKTMIAKEYIKRHENDYDHIILAPYESTLAELIAGENYFVIDGISRKSLESDEEYCRRKLDAVKASSTEKTLIVIDNFDTDDDEFLQEFLDAPYKVIITTRMNFEHLGFDMIHVGSVKKEEQLEFFRKNCKMPITEQDMPHVERIFELLGGHALAIVLIARLVSSKRMKFSEMADQLELKGINPDMTGNVRHRFKKAATVYDHIEEIFNLDSLNDEEHFIMKCLALLPIAGASFSDVMEWCRIDDAEVVNSLIDKSWVQIDTVSDRISLHPVIADIVRSRDTQPFVSCRTMLDSLSEKFNMAYEMDAETRIKYSEYARSIYRRLNYISKESFTLYYGILDILGKADYIDLSEKLIAEMREKFEGEDSLEVSWLYYNIVDLRFKYWDFAVTSGYMEKAVEISRRIAPDSYDHAYLVKYLGNVYQGHYYRSRDDKYLVKKAFECFKEGERLLEKCIADGISPSNIFPYDTYGSRDADGMMATLYYSLALNYYYSEDYETALDYGTKSYLIYYNNKKLNNYLILSPMRTLSRIYAKLGNYDDALKYVKSALDIRMKQWGEDHIRYFETFETIADIYIEAGNTAEALASLEHALSIAERNPETYEMFIRNVKRKIASLKK